MEKLSSGTQHSQFFSEGLERPVLTPDQEQLRSNKLQLAWALSRFSDRPREEQMLAAGEWLGSEEGAAVSEWFRQAVMNFQDASGQFARRAYFLGGIDDTETELVPGTLIRELEALYQASRH